MQQWIQPAQEAPYGRRIGVDGKVEELTGLTASFQEGELRYAEQTAEWREVGTAGPEALGHLEAVIATSPLEVPELPGPTVAKAELTWTVGEREIRLTDAHLQIAPALAALDEAFQLVYAHATANDDAG